MLLLMDIAINSKDTKNLNKKKNKLFKILGTIAAGINQ